MKIIAILATFALTTGGLQANDKDTMCVKQKNGTYKCKASGKIEKVPCCDTPDNRPAPTATPKK